MYVQNKTIIASLGQTTEKFPYYFYFVTKKPQRKKEKTEHTTKGEKEKKIEVMTRLMTCILKHYKVRSFLNWSYTTHKR